MNYYLSMSGWLFLSHRRREPSAWGVTLRVFASSLIDTMPAERAAETEAIEGIAGC